MAKGGSGAPQETAKDRALADVAKAKVADWRQRMRPLQQMQAKRIDEMGGEDSVERHQARAMATTDADAAFAQANQQAQRQVSLSGNTGQSSDKLGVTTRANDQASSVGSTTAQTDMNVDAARIGGLSNVVALGQGREANALNAMAADAGMARQMAAADAEASLARDASTAALLSKGAGMAAGAYMTRKPEAPVTSLTPLDRRDPNYFNQGGGVIIPGQR